ncbi:MAG: hypothetical protein KAQ78_05195, partial [Candidatus Latescibacteria bacterium]|nr:hypothetical protein [Candidatus Latescibacterota bacterium]
VDTVVLQENAEEFRGVWSYPGTGRFHVRIFAEDEAGNGTESRPLDVLVFYIPSGPPSSGEWTTWTNTGEVTALTFQGNTLWAGTTGGVVRWDLSNGTYVEYTILDGMAGNHVSSLLIDASGNLWAHTKEGLCYYDWAGWKRATDGDAVIGERDIGAATPIGGLLLDHSGNVWVGGLNGVSRYDGTTWTTWTGQDIGLPSLWKPTVLLEDHAGNVWAGGWFGVGSFDGEMWTAWTSYAFSFIRTLGVDDLGRVWAGAGNWVSRFDGSEWNHWRTGGDVNRLLSDGSGKLWVGTTKGVSRFDGIGWTDWSIEDDLGGSEGQTSRFDFYRGKCHGVGSLLADSAGHVWAGTYGGGVSRFDGESWQNYGVEKGLKSGIVNSLTLDPSGRVWAATGYTGDPGGVSRFEDSGWINLDTEGALTGNDIRDLLLDARGDVWIATAGGVNRIHGSEWSYWSAKDGLQPFGSDALQLDGAGNVWMRTANEGVWRFEDSGWTKQSPELDGGQLKTLFPDASGAMVAHLDTGVLMRFEDGQWEQWTALESLTKGRVRCPLADPFGNLWMIIQAMGGNAVSALARFDGTHWTTWPAKENLPGSDIWALLCDGQGDMWVGLTPESER